MPCPVCGGENREPLGDEVYQCRSQTIVSLVPPGQGANFGVAAIPIYDVCNARYTREASDRVLELRAENARRQHANREAQQASVAASAAARAARERAALIGSFGPNRYELSVLVRSNHRSEDDWPADERG